MCLKSDAMNPACVKVFDPAQELAFQADAAGGLWLAGDLSLWFAGAIILPVCFVLILFVYLMACRRGGDHFKAFTCQLIFSGKPCGDCSRSPQIAGLGWEGE